jgi:hypothetical protein
MNHLLLALLAVLANLVLSVVVLTVFDTRSVNTESLKATWASNKQTLLVSGVITGVFVLMALKSVPPMTPSTLAQLKANLFKLH